jgi:hypothetical protein
VKSPIDFRRNRANDGAMPAINREIEAVTRELRRRSRLTGRVATAAEAIWSATERRAPSRAGEKARVNGGDETFVGAEPLEAAPRTKGLDEEAVRTWASEGRA